MHCIEIWKKGQRLADGTMLCLNSDRQRITYSVGYTYHSFSGTLIFIDVAKKDIMDRHFCTWRRHCKQKVITMSGHIVRRMLFSGFFKIWPEFPLSPSIWLICSLSKYIFEFRVDRFYCTTISYYQFQYCWLLKRLQKSWHRHCKWYWRRRQCESKWHFGITPCIGLEQYRRTGL